MYRVISIICLLLLIVNFARAGELILASNIKGDSINIGEAQTLNTNGHTLDIGSGGISIDGTLNAGSSEIQCGGNWTLDSGGTFTASTSTVVLDGSNQTISGNTEFYALNKSVTETDTLSFDHNSTQTITGSLELQGAADNLLHLRSTQDDDAFGITYSGEDSNLSLSYLNVKDSDATGGKTLTALSSVDVGNNSHWSFSEMISAYIKAWLEGPYNISTDSMSTALKDNSYIPNQSPYDADPISVDTIPDNVTDWVLVELRETADGSAVSSKSMFLESNGDIISTTGSAPEFPDLNVGDYFVVVRHRNHLAIMSKLAHTFVAKGGSLETLDLRNSADVYGENGVKELEADVWGMYVGDVNNTGHISASDRNAVRTATGFGYLATDLNLSGHVSATDRNIIKTANGFSQVP